MFIMNFDILIPLVGLLLGFVFLYRLSLLGAAKRALRNKGSYPDVSVIIPSRNEEKNIGRIIESLKSQDYPSVEIIVVDDSSEDRTAELAELSSAKVVSLKDEGLVSGKATACYAGYLNSKGEILIFLDADVVLSADAVRRLLNLHLESRGVISVQPFLLTRNFSEKLSLLFYLISSFAVNILGKPQGMFGDCILFGRDDYERIGGHKAVKDEILEDIALARLCREFDIEIRNFTGKDFLYAYMYPGGLKEVFFGWSKYFPLGYMAVSPLSFLLAFLWVSGLISSEIDLFSKGYVWLYVLYAVQLYFLGKMLGQFGSVMPAIHFVPTVFFLTVFFYSLVRIVLFGKVKWKGREIDLRRAKNL
jgi:glycosyltransferase involved in cell wall biosynthesis